MALSNSRDFITTRNDIIESALRKVKAIPQNGLPTTSQYSNCSKALNAIVKFLHVEDGVFLWESSLGNTTIVPGTNTYLITNNVLSIDNVYVKRNDVDYPLFPVTRSEYSQYSNKLLSGMPTQFIQELLLTGLSITIYPVGTTGIIDTLYYTQYTLLQDYDTDTNNTPFPVYWVQPLIYLLAFDLSHEYGIAPEEQVTIGNKAQYYKQKALAFGTEKGSIRFSPGRR